MDGQITLSGGGYSLLLDPIHGASVLDARWDHPTHGSVLILEPLPDPAAGLKAGSFVMAPFANRIAGGRFVFAGGEVRLPVNRPEEDVAIHGFSRTRVWQIAETGPDHATLVDDFAQPDVPYRYHLIQKITVGAEGIRISLTITNRGDGPLPYGFGLHPWFPRTTGATLSFAADGWHARDDRGLPTEQIRPQPAFGPTPLPLSGLPHFDGVFSGWTPRRATIRWPETGTTLDLTAEGALRHLHVFVPDDRLVFCAEPVSHLPDVLNRPQLGDAAGMTTLAPGEALSGAMVLKASAY